MRPREGLGLRVGQSLTINREQLIGAAHLVNAKDIGVENGEDDGDQPEAEPHRRHNRQGHEGRPSERAQGEADVSHHIVEQHRATHQTLLAPSSSAQEETS